MGERAQGMVRARIRRNGRGIELGYFKTKAEVAAAQEVAHAILDEWDEVKDQTPKLPSPVILMEAVNQGAYDTVIEALAAAISKRHNLVKRLMNPRGGSYGTLENAKWQALKEKSNRREYHR